MYVTIFKNLYDKQPHYIKIVDALNRIKNGNSRAMVEQIRQQLSKDRADVLKKNLPAVCFGGKFTGERKDESLISHSGVIVLDFDNLKDLREKQTEIISNKNIYACWVSPRGNGLKALVKISDHKKHRDHFQALQEIFPEVDASGVNESRVCFESYDAEIYINPDSEIFTKIKKVERIEVRETIENETEIFNRIVKWLVNKGSSFQTGERNTYIYKLASACCRFGIDETNCYYLINNTYLTKDNSFSKEECKKTVKSAYRSNKNIFSSARFELDVLVEKVTRKEIEVEAEIEADEKMRDVVFGEDVKAEALSIYDNGYPYVEGIGIIELDELFKDKRGEITLLSGIGNYGKSTYQKWRMLMRVLKFKNKFAVFGPEDNPPEEFYHDFVEMLFGCDCTPKNQNRPSRDIYEKAYDFVSKYIFYVYPKELAPTPEYIKERFLELIIKEKIDGCCIDPFNQLQNDYKSSGGRSDKFLETALSDWGRFSQTNNIFFTIIAHPKLMRKQDDGNYPCPDVFDINDGAMWNNKMDNIIIYHRPVAQKDLQSPSCELHSKKIRRQKQVGKKGSIEFEYARSARRFFFSGMDYMQQVLNENDFDFAIKKAVFGKTWSPVDNPKELF